MCEVKRMDLEIKQMFGAIMQKLETMDKRFDAIDNRLSNLESRMTAVESRQDEIFNLAKAIEHSNSVHKSEIDNLNFKTSNIQGTIDGIGDLIVKRKAV